MQRVLSPHPETAAGSNNGHDGYLTSTVHRLKGALANELNSIWAEILPLLIALEWDRAASGLTSISLQNSMPSVQAWMQVLSLHRLNMETFFFHNVNVNYPLSCIQIII